MLRFLQIILARIAYHGSLSEVRVEINASVMSVSLIYNRRTKDRISRLPAFDLKMSWLTMFRQNNSG